MIECGGKYSDTSGSLYQFKRDEVSVGNADFTVNNGAFNSQSFKYKAALAGKIADPVTYTNSSVLTQE